MIERIAVAERVSMERRFALGVAQATSRVSGMARRPSSWERSAAAVVKK